MTLPFGWSTTEGSKEDASCSSVFIIAAAATTTTTTTTTTAAAAISAVTAAAFDSPMRRSALCVYKICSVEQGNRKNKLNC